MIRIRRGPEPAALKPVRDAELKRIRPIATLGPVSSETIGKRYRIVKEDLLRAQHHKCCYCEKPYLEASHNDVEHYRPKGRADRGAGFPNHGYWWLTWTWANLIVACPVCNRAEKNDEFPLDKGSTALLAEERPPGVELPLLVDPSRENPMQHIQFRRVALKGKEQWLPTPTSGTLKAFKTIEVLGLNRPALLEFFEIHVKQTVEPVIDRLSGEIASGNQSGVQKLWREQAVVLTEPDRGFAALSYDALDHFVPQSVRRVWKLRLTRPK